MKLAYIDSFLLINSVSPVYLANPDAEISPNSYGVKEEMVIIFI